MRITHSSSEKVTIQVLNDHNQYLSLLADVANHLLLGENPGDVLNDEYGRLRAVLQTDVYLYYVVAADDESLELAGSAGLPEEDATHSAWLSSSAALCRRAVAQRTSIIVDNIQIQAGADSRTDLLRSLGLTAYICHPLIADDQVIGALCIGSRQLQRFDSAAQTLIRTLCDQIAA